MRGTVLLNKGRAGLGRARYRTAKALHVYALLCEAVRGIALRRHSMAKHRTAQQRLSMAEPGLAQRRLGLAALIAETLCIAKAVRS